MVRASGWLLPPIGSEVAGPAEAVLVIDPCPEW